MKEWFCGTSTFDVKFDKNFICLAILAKIVNFGLDPNISDAKTDLDSFISFGADLFVYLNHKGIQIT